MPIRRGRWLVPLIGVLAFVPVLAHETKSAGARKTQPPGAEQKDFGVAGDPARVDRTISIRMTDRMRFEPSIIHVKQGETIRFVHRNVGKVMHEMVIGTRAELEGARSADAEVPGHGA